RGRVARELLHFAGGETFELQLLEAGARRAAPNREQLLQRGRAALARGDDQQALRRLFAAEHLFQEQRAVVVAPLQVVDDQHEALALREAREQLTQRRKA